MCLYYLQLILGWYPDKIYVGNQLKDGYLYIFRATISCASFVRWYRSISRPDMMYGATYRTSIPGLLSTVNSAATCTKDGILVMAAMPKKAKSSIPSEKLVTTTSQLGKSSKNLLKRSKRPVGNMLQLGMSQRAQFHP